MTESSPAPGAPPQFPDLVPALAVSDLAQSLRFWRDACGFALREGGPGEGHAGLQLGGARVVLEELDAERQGGRGALERPFGRGVTLQVTVPSIDPVLDGLAGALRPLFRAPAERWARVGAEEVGVAEFAVQDPDGYLLRFSARLGARGLPD